MIQKLPEWNWPRILALHMLISLVTLSISSLMMSASQVKSTTTSLGLLPALMISFVLFLGFTFFLSFVFYYYFQLFLGRHEVFKRIFFIVCCAEVHFFLLQILASYLPPITLVGFAFTAFLLITGFATNLKIEKRKSIEIVTFIFVSVFIVWLINRINTAKQINNSQVKQINTDRFNGRA